MPHIKPISGHTKLGAAQRYFEKEDRAIAHDYINLDARKVGRDESGLPIYAKLDWATLMDRTRHENDNDKAWGKKKARTYKHYVVSPDPEDRIDLPTLRKLASTWAEKHFGDFQVAIVYHNDNTNHIPHAHVVVNNTNIFTGRRLQDPDPGALNGSLQSVARDMELTHFIGRIDGGMREETHIRRKAVDRSERSLTERGEYSWVADIRARIDVARGISRTPTEFQANLHVMGIHVRESASHKGDWVYSLADTPSRQVTGPRLGATYSKNYVTSELSGNMPTPLLNDKDAIRTAATSAIEVSDLSELTHLAEAVRTVSQGGFKSLAGLNAAITRVRKEGKHPATLERLIRVRTYCETHNILTRYPAKQSPLLRADYEKRADFHPSGPHAQTHSTSHEHARPDPSPKRPQGRER